MVALRAVWAYLRSRDPVDRDVLLVFAAPTPLFVLDILRPIFGQPPLLASNVTAALLMMQPFLTLRLAARVRRVPRWLTATALIAYAASAVPLMVAPRPRPPAVVLALVGVFIITELTAAAYFAREARQRTGPSATRLAFAAWATGLFAATMIVAGSAKVVGPAATMVARVLALLSGLGYLMAFLPPRWLRGVWAAKSWAAANRHILGGAATATAEEVWRRYAEVVRSMVGTAAVAVVMRARGVERAGNGAAIPPETGGEALLQPAYDGFTGEPPVGCAANDLDALLRAHQPVALRGRRGSSLRLTQHYSRILNCEYVSACPLVVPPDGRGAVLLFHDHRSLFADDDLRLLADLGGQAGILAERGDVIAEQRRLADELAATVEALRAASQAKSSFLASMSHELRTPLNAIIGFSDLMRGEPEVHGQRSVPADWVDHIHSSGRHLLGLINDVLDLAKVEAGRLDLHPVPLRLDTAANELLTSLRPLVDGKELTVDTEMPPLTANVDPVRFRQMLENLLSNAIKFTPSGGRIRVIGRGERTNVIVTVADTGVGIAQADHDRVFEEFQQVGDPSQRKAGTGLGLALTRRLAQAHGGDVTLESAVGEGSRFSICLPIAAPAQPDGETPAKVGASDQAGGGPARGRVLLIEDDVRSAELVRTYLSDGGYDVEVAGTGEAGIAAARRRPPDAILLDVVLPGMQGWDVLRQLKSEPRLAPVPVFLVSVVDERRIGEALGAAEYFVKPVEHTQLLGALSRHIPDQGPASVLVVEPDDDARDQVERSLRDAGATVVSCGDGRRGLELSRQQQFDLIVCDLQMPEVDGLALLSALQENPANRQTPVLALTPSGVGRDGGPVVVGTVHGTAAEGSAGWRSLMTLTSGRPADEASPEPPR